MSTSARIPPRQLALALPHEESFSREDFLEGPSNAQALALVESWPDWPNRIMMLVGPEGGGKSHLATMWADIAGARTISAHLLTGANVPSTLATGALVIEDLDATTFDSNALFHVLNLAREDGAYVLLTCRTPATLFDLTLRDLRSRLRAVPVVEMLPPDDALFRALIIKLCADRQMAVDEQLVSYLTTRIERSFSAARSTVARLDEEALRLRRPVTRALAGEIFADNPA